MNKYVNILKEHEIKVTPQRLEIMKYLDEHREHPNVDKIYSALKKKNPSLSKTTIYNTLETLREHNIIQALTISGNELRYDFKNSVHHHFLCKECGQIFDIDVECPNLNKMLKDEYRVDEVHGYFKGECKACREKEEKRKK
ncbi:MAG: transcriptional repressor [Methanomassiliicoccales archaeon]|nr:MAG: transcriptional repressor [Methanomassiliicoccales archaeon]